MTLSNNEETIDKLRKSYLQKSPYVFSPYVSKERYSHEEIRRIETYGHWLEAITNGEIPLVTDKVKHFYESQHDINFTGRSNIEELWFKYKNDEPPF